MKDLKPMVKEIETVIKKYLELDEKPGLAIAMTLPPKFNNVYWVSNLDRKDGIMLLDKTAQKMLDDLDKMN